MSKPVRVAGTGEQVDHQILNLNDKEPRQCPQIPTK